MADQKRRSIARATNRTVEDFLNIDILFFRTPSGIRWNEEQACYQRDKARIYCIETAIQASTHEIPIITFAIRLTHAWRSVSPPCLLRQVSSVASRTRGN